MQILPFYLARLVSLAACYLSSAICYGQSLSYAADQVIVPFAGGSASDVVTRIVLERMGEAHGPALHRRQPPGAGGNTGTAAAAQGRARRLHVAGRAPAGPLAANKTLYQDLGYEPEKDFEPIGLFAMIPIIIVVSTKLPMNSLNELVAYAKAHPGELRLRLGRHRQLAAPGRRIFRADHRHRN